jgi:hypothetical protein
MERIAFLIEETGERLSCLLNPENVVVRRQAGVRRQASATGVVTGTGLTDDPLVATGGGITELELDLLFDVEVARGLTLAAVPPQAAGAAEVAPPPPTVDVRELTRPIWTLTENAEGAEGYGAPPVVRLIWGKSWNFPAVVMAAAEKLEQFSPEGVPGRSWLRLRLRRVSDTEARPLPRQPVTPQFETAAPPDTDLIESAPQIELPVDELGLPSLRLDQVAARYLGNPAAWRWLAETNGIDNPLELEEGTVISVVGLADGVSS